MIIAFSPSLRRLNRALLIVIIIIIIMLGFIYCFDFIVISVKSVKTDGTRARTHSRYNELRMHLFILFLIFVRPERAEHHLIDSRHRHRHARTRAIVCNRWKSNEEWFSFVIKNLFIYLLTDASVSICFWYSILKCDQITPMCANYPPYALQHSVMSFCKKRKIEQKVK